MDLDATGQAYKKGLRKISPPPPKRNKYSVVPPDSHGVINYWLNDNYVTDLQKMQAISDTMPYNCNQSKWKPQTAVKAYSVSKDDKRRLKLKYFEDEVLVGVQLLDYKKARCKEAGKIGKEKLTVIDCIIDGYGLVQLIDPYFHLPD